MIDTMAPPNGVQQTKWGTVLGQLATVGDLLEESTQGHLNPDAVYNVLNESVVKARKLAVELESVMAVVRRASQKAEAT